MTEQENIQRTQCGESTSNEGERVSVSVYFEGGSMDGKHLEMNPASLHYNIPDGDSYEIRKNEHGRYIGVLRRAVIQLQSVELMQYEKSIAGSIVIAEEKQVTSQVEYNEASEIRKRMRQLKKSLEETRKSIVAPIKKYTSAIDAHCREIRLPLEKADAALGRRQAAWLDEERRKERERLERERREREEQALRNAEKLEEMGAPEIADQVLDQADKVTQAEEQIQKPFLQKTQTAHASTTATVDWDFAVLDIEKVPGKFLEVRRSAVMAEIRAQYNRGIEVPKILGLAIQKKTKVNVR